MTYVGPSDRLTAPEESKAQDHIGADGCFNRIMDNSSIKVGTEIATFKENYNEYKIKKNTNGIEIFKNDQKISIFEKGNYQMIPQKGKNKEGKDVTIADTDELDKVKELYISQIREKSNTLRNIIEFKQVDKGVIFKVNIEGENYIMANTNEGLLIQKEADSKKDWLYHRKKPSGLLVHPGSGQDFDGDPICLKVIDKFKTHLTILYSMGQAASSAGKSEQVLHKRAPSTTYKLFARGDTVKIQNEIDQQKGKQTGMTISKVQNTYKMTQFSIRGKSKEVLDASLLFSSHQDTERTAVRNLVSFLNKSEDFKKEGVFLPPKQEVTSELNTLKKKLLEDPTLLEDPKTATLFDDLKSDKATMAAELLKATMKDLNIFGLTPELAKEFRAIDSSDNKVVAFKNLIAKLPEEDQDVLRDLLSILSKVAKSDKSQMDTDHLATEFAPILCDQIDVYNVFDNIMIDQRVAKFMIEHVNDIFPEG